jgi:hypothetical protein
MPAMNISEVQQAHEWARDAHSMIDEIGRRSEEAAAGTGPPWSEQDVAEAIANIAGAVSKVAASLYRVTGFLLERPD